MRLLITALVLALCPLGWACDSGEEGDETQGTAVAHEACTADKDCIQELFCHPVDRVCVISEDPCVGVTYAGICDADGAVVWCEDGGLKGIDCVALGKVCELAPAKGVYDCVEAE
jgi:hypothetical protein